MASRLILGLFLLAAAAARASDGVATPEREADWASRREEAKALRQKGAARKSEAEARFSAREKECFQKFRVIDCQQEARQQYIEASHEAQRIENAGLALERQVKKEELAQKDARRLAEAPQREADLKLREAETRIEREESASSRAAKSAGKEEKARIGAERHAAHEERLRRKQEAHERKVAEKMAKARQREAGKEE